MEADDLDESNEESLKAWYAAVAASTSTAVDSLPPIPVRVPSSKERKVKTAAVVVKAANAFSKIRRITRAIKRMTLASSSEFSITGEAKGQEQEAIPEEEGGDEEEGQAGKTTPEEKEKEI